MRTETGSTPWIVAQSSPDSARLLLQYQGVWGPDIRSRLDRVDVKEGADTVRIALTQTIRYGRKANKWVTRSAIIDVELGAPLGGRRLVHAPVAPDFNDLVPLAVPPNHEV